MIGRLGVVLGLVVAFAVFTAWKPLPAAAEIEVRSQTVQNRFPEGLNFTIFMASNAEINAVRLRYRVLPDGSLATVRPMCTAGTVVNCTAVAGRSQDSYIAPGQEIQYFWEIEDASGQKLNTPQASTTYHDTRFEWRPFTDRNVTAYIYFGEDQVGQSVLRTARDTIDKFSAIENTRVEIPIKIWVYQSTRDLSAAAQGGRRSDNVHLGQLAADDTVLVSRDVDFLNVVRHEVAHAVTAQATRGFLAGIPIWINEGISTYSQTRLLDNEATALDLAIRRNRMLPITGMTASARDQGDTVSLFYAQAYSLVKFLIETQGQEKFAQFIAAMRDDTMDGALKKVYGFDQFAFEDRWRVSLGLPAVNAGGASSSGSAQTLPTIVPFGSGQQAPVATPAGGQPSTGQTATTEDDGGGGSDLPMVAGLAALVLIVAGGGIFALRMRSAKR
jgi:hypothetical protein